MDMAYIEDGILVNSSQFDGLTTMTLLKNIRVDNQIIRERTTQYKLRDWLVSVRGKGHSFVYCAKCGIFRLRMNLPVKPLLQTVAASQEKEIRLKHATNLSM